jgi:hypothetical protein
LRLTWTRLFVARVTVCTVTGETGSAIGPSCDFRGPDAIGIIVGVLLAVVLFYLLAAHESTYQATPTPRWKRLIAVGAYGALKRSDTPHRRKSISSLVLLVFFYLVVAVLPIAFG